MSRRDKWGAFMIGFTIVMAIAGAAVGIPSEQWPGFFIGCGIIYWMGTGFIKDEAPKDQG